MDGKYTACQTSFCTKSSLWQYFRYQSCACQWNLLPRRHRWRFCCCFSYPSAAKFPLRWTRPYEKPDRNTRFFSKYYLRRKSSKRIRCVYIFHVQWFNYGRISFHLWSIRNLLRTKRSCDPYPPKVRWPTPYRAKCVRAYCEKIWPAAKTVKRYRQKRKI